MSKTVEVFKYHSYGNDFLIIWEGSVQPADYSAFSRSICRRHQGVGADGCIFLAPVATDRFSFRLFNQDGSEAGLSGNGTRCCCAFVHHQKISNSDHLILQARSGDKHFELLEATEGCWAYRSSLGEPDFSAESIPFRPQGKVLDHRGPITDFPLRVGKRTLRVTTLSMGNPQCQLLLDELPTPQEFQDLGAALERHPDFPDRTNVGFVVVESRHRLKLQIWERGVGPTCSSGTGSSAAAVAAILNNRAESPIEVSTETGTQKVEWNPGSPVLLTGRSWFVARIDYFFRP